MLLGFALACGPLANEPQVPSGIGFAVTPASLSVRDTLHLTLTNNSTVSLGYNLCFITVERQVGRNWVKVPWSSLRICALVIRGLLPGQVATEVLTLDTSFPPARYRVRTSVEWPIGHQVPLPSNAFELTQ